MLKYNRKAGLVVAVQLAFVSAVRAGPQDTLTQQGDPLFYYEMWGGTQAAKLGDWVVKNGDETYTVDQDSFAATYVEHSPGLYRKVASVWAFRAPDAGKIKTKEGYSDYEAGDFLAYNKRRQVTEDTGCADGTLIYEGHEYSDGYVIKPNIFQGLYEPAEPIELAPHPGTYV